MSSSSSVGGVGRRFRRLTQLLFGGDGDLVEGKADALVVDGPWHSGGKAILIGMEATQVTTQNLEEQLH